MTSPAIGGVFCWLPLGLTMGGRGRYLPRSLPALGPCPHPRLSEVLAYPPPTPGRLPWPLALSG